MALPVPWMIRLGILFCRDCLSLEEASVRGVFPVGGSLKCWNRNTLSPTSLDCWPCYSPSLTSVLLLPFTFFLSSIFFFISVHFLIPNEQRVRGDGEPSLAPRSFRHHSPVFLHSQHDSISQSYQAMNPQSIFQCPWLLPELQPALITLGSSCLHLWLGPQTGLNKDPLGSTGKLHGRCIGEARGARLCSLTAPPIHLWHST